MKRKYKILVVSSRPEDHSGRLCRDTVDLLREAGHDVTFNFEGFDAFYKNRVIGRKRPEIVEIIVSLTNKLLRRLHFVGSNRYNSFSNKGYIFYNWNERRYSRAQKEFVARCNGTYDVIMCYFYDALIDAATLSALHAKFKVPIIIAGIDMSAMTGGCYYFDSCREFRNQCLNCPAIQGLKTNRPHDNFLCKRQVYAECDAYLTCNTWMSGYFKQSGIVDDDKLLKGYYILDEEFYRPFDKALCRKELGVPVGKTKIFVMRWQDIPRKGCHYAINALNALYGSLSEKDRETLLLVTIGDKMINKPLCDVLELGRVEPDKLAKVYNVATAFLCPSTDDAGPSMVNQAQACGTPVVAFNSGTAIDVVFTGETGYRAEVRDGRDFYNGVKYIYNMTDDDLNRMRDAARKMALDCNSRAAGVRTMEAYLDKVCSQENSK